MIKIPRMYTNLKKDNSRATLNISDVMVMGGLIKLLMDGATELPSNTDIAAISGVKYPKVSTAFANLASTSVIENEKRVPLIKIEKVGYEKGSSRIIRKFKIYIPGHGLCDDPKVLAWNDGDGGVYNLFGLYVRIDDDILFDTRFTSSEKFVLAAFKQLRNSSDWKDWRYYNKMLCRVGIFKDRVDEIEEIVRELEDKGVLKEFGFIRKKPALSRSQMTEAVAMAVASDRMDLAKEMAKRIPDLGKLPDTTEDSKTEEEKKLELERAKAQYSKAFGIVEAIRELGELGVDVSAIEEQGLKLAKILSDNITTLCEYEIQH